MSIIEVSQYSDNSQKRGDFNLIFFCTLTFFFTLSSHLLGIGYDFSQCGDKKLSKELIAEIKRGLLLRKTLSSHYRQFFKELSSSVPFTQTMSDATRDQIANAYQRIFRSDDTSDPTKILTAPHTLLSPSEEEIQFHAQASHAKEIAEFLYNNEQEHLPPFFKETIKEYSKFINDLDIPVNGSFILFIRTAQEYLRELRSP